MEWKAFITMWSTTRQPYLLPSLLSSVNVLQFPLQLFGKLALFFYSPTLVSYPRTMASMLKSTMEFSLFLNVRPLPFSPSDQHVFTYSALSIHFGATDYELFDVIIILSIYAIIKSAITYDTNSLGCVANSLQSDCLFLFQIQTHLVMVLDLG